MGQPKYTLQERFWAKVDTSAGPDGCWLWTAATAHGYGRIWHATKIYRAHRVAYELLIGPIPGGLQIDHLCRTPLCVNPSHLEPVTETVHILRGVGWSAINARKTHCPQGHEYTKGNTYRAPNGRRHCRTCRTIWNRRSRLARVSVTSTERRNHESTS